jgi:hypothetical protein
MATNNILNNNNVPMFSYREAHDFAGVTGDGTPFIIPFDTSLYSNGTTLAAGVFTAPISGLYSFTASIAEYAASQRMSLVLETSSSEKYVLCTNNNMNEGGTGYWTGLTYLRGNALVYLPAAATAWVVFTGFISGLGGIIQGSDTFVGLNPTTFSGSLVSVGGTHLF